MLRSTALSCLFVYEGVRSPKYCAMTARLVLSYIRGAETHNTGIPYSLRALLVAWIDIFPYMCKRSSKEREQMLAQTSRLDRWPGELNEVDLLIQKNHRARRRRARPFFSSWKGKDSAKACLSIRYRRGYA